MTLECKIGCVHAQEAIQLLLNRTPQRLTTNEIIAAINYSKTTTRTALNELVETEKINSHALGENTLTIYWNNNIRSHYRTIANALGLSVNQELREDLLYQFGYEITKHNSKAIFELQVDKDPSQKSIIETVNHMGPIYPFFDVEYREEDQPTIYPIAEFEIIYDPEGEIKKFLATPSICARHDKCPADIMEKGALDATFDMTQQIGCMTTKEAVYVLLSGIPQRFTAEEIASATNFDTQDIERTLRELEENATIKSYTLGRNLKHVYWNTSILDHYLSTAQIIYNLPYKNDDDANIVLKRFGYHLTQQYVDSSLFNQDFLHLFHQSLGEAIVHITQAYPFTDIEYIKKEGKTEINPIVQFGIDQDRLSHDEFYLQIYPCLCRGKEENKLACKMVEGALEGAVEKILDAEATVSIEQCDRDGKHGQFCTFKIESNYEGTREHLTQKTKN